MHPCPDCRHELIEVTFDSEKAGKIHCWYCSFCGGAFFDHWDSNLLNLEEIKNELSRVFYQEENTEKINVEPECPFDQSAMLPVVSPAVPAGVRVFYCPFCHGNWFPRAELKKFKEEQEKKVSKFKNLNIPLTSISAVFLPLLLVAVLLGSAFVVRRGFLSTPQNISVGASVFHKMLHLKKIGPNAVEISFYTEEPVKSTILYKKNGMPTPLSQKEGSYSRYHYAVISNLDNPDDYLFQVTSISLLAKEYNSEWLSAK